MLYVVFRDEEGYFVAKITERARCVAGPFGNQQSAASCAERLATKASVQAVWGTWPAEYQQAEYQYAAELGVDSLPREAWIVRD